MIIEKIEILNSIDETSCGDHKFVVETKHVNYCFYNLRQTLLDGLQEVPVMFWPSNDMLNPIKVGKVKEVELIHDSYRSRVTVDLEITNEMFTYDKKFHTIDWWGNWETDKQNQYVIPNVTEICIKQKHIETSHDQTYMTGLKEILDNGVEKTDRTGTGTISVIGMMLKYDLRDGTIPLLTTKKINTQTLLNELLWFIKGSGSGKRLIEKGVKIWNEWMTPDQHLNYLYGYQWRFWPCAKVTKSMLVKDKSNFKLDSAISITREDINNSVKNHSTYEDYFYIWQNFLRNCMDQEWLIDPDWLVYENFAHDIIYVPGFLKYQNDYDEYYLTPLWSNSNIVHRDTVGFMHLDVIHNIQNGCKWVKFDKHEWLCDVNHGQGFMPDVEGYVRRPKLHHDQLQDAIDLIKKDPYSRRIIVNSWNVDMLDQMQLPPCHFNFQFINQPVGNKIETSLKLDMRSNDYCLGNPFNIAQYAIMLRKVCHICGTVPGDLIYVGTDVHIYSNHIEQARMQLERLGMQTPSPTLRFVDRTIETIDDFTIDDIIIENYTPMPFIKFPIAV